MGSSTIEGLNLSFKVGLMVVLFAASSTALLEILESPKTTCSYLRNYGADCETHKVTTSDDYILTLFRVKCGQSSANKGITLLQHGFLVSSSDWVLLGNQSLGLYLCQKGYDVWLGNSRGNRYSKDHVTLSTLNPKYWAFSWHEMGIYDLPAVISYILAQTQETKLHYVGHSQGTTEFMVYASTFPDEAKDSIHSAHLLSPVGYIYNMTSLFASLAPVLGLPDPTSNIVGDVELTPNTLVSGLAGQVACKDTSLVKNACENLFFLLAGYSENMDADVYAELLNIFPSGSSLRQAKHFLQGKIAPYFRPFNFGTLINLKAYGSITPAEYELEKIRVNTYVYSGSFDNIAAPSDVYRTISRFNQSLLKRFIFVPTYNHFDMLYSRTVLQDVNYLVEEDIANSRSN